MHYLANICMQLSIERNFKLMPSALTVKQL